MFTCWSCSGFLWTSLASSSKLQSCWNRVRDVPPAPWKAATTSWLVRLLLTWNKLWSFFFKEDESQFRSPVSPEWSDKNHPKTLIPTYTKHMPSFHSSIQSISKFFCCTCSFTCWQHLQPLTHLLLCKSPAPRNVAISMLVEPTPEQMRNPSKPHGNAPGMWTKHKTCHEWDHCSTVPSL